MSLPGVDWVPLLPVLAVTATALVVLIADLFLTGPDRDALAWLASSGSSSPRACPRSSGDTRGERSATRFVIDDYALFFDLLFCAASLLSTLMAVDYLTTTPVRPGRILRARAVRDRRHDDDGRRDGPDRHLPRSRGHVDRRLRAGRCLATGRSLERGRAQVLPARRLRHRLPALRHRAALRRDRRARGSMRSPLISRATASRRGRCCSSASGFSSSASASRWRPCRSTSGRRTSTRARRRR